MCGLDVDQLDQPSVGRGDFAVELMALWLCFGV